MEQPNDHNRKVKKPAKLVLDFYPDLFTFKQQPVTQAMLERIAEELIRWAIEDDDALTMTQFAIKRNIHPITLNRWSKKYDVIKEAYQTAMNIIGSRREVGGLKNKYNVSMVSSQMAKYDDSWKDLETWRAELKASTQRPENREVTYTVVTESFGSNGKTDNMPKED